MTLFVRILCNSVQLGLRGDLRHLQPPPHFCRSSVSGVVSCTAYAQRTSLKLVPTNALDRCPHRWLCRYAIPRLLTNVPRCNSSSSQTWRSETVYKSSMKRREENLQTPKAAANTTKSHETPSKSCWRNLQ